MKVIDFKGHVYPAFQADGFAARFCFPFAMEICKGVGVDIGYSKPEWKFPGALGIDNEKICAREDNEEYKYKVDANHIIDFVPENGFDYIFSSHLLEHLSDWVDALDYWTGKIKSGGHLFLYLPDRSQKYWSPWSNRKHIHSFDPEIIREYLESSEDYKNIFVSGVDAYNSFTAFAEKI